MPVQVNSQRLHALLRELVDIYSPSGKEEQIADFLVDRLRSCGLRTETQTVEGDRYNILISSGERKPTTLFLGHIDTVPAYDIERYGFTEREGWCYGLGTADMKGGCAAMVEAFMSAHEQATLSGDVMLALVVGEEETGDGTRALLESRAFEQAIVGEPTELQPCFGHCGYVEMVVRAFGARRHAAMSGPETNAIRALLRFLLSLETYVENDDAAAVLNIRDLHSSESGFAVPDRCVVAVDLHIPPHTSAADYAARLRSFAEEFLSGSMASSFEIEFPTLADGYQLGADIPIARNLRRAMEHCTGGCTPRIFQSHSDANLLRAAGCDAVIFGPGQLAKAHTVDEAVQFEQVVFAARIYAEFLRPSA